MQLRIARHTSDISPVLHFYTEIIGLEVIGSFKQHSGYDGIFIGKPGMSWHLEFTQSENLPNHSADQDDLLVFYPETIREYEDILSKFASHHIAPVTPANPYWTANGTTFTDPDGFNVVISPVRCS